MPAAFSQDGKLNFVVVDENKGANTNNQLQSQYVQPQAQQSQVQYQQPITQQPQYQYVQPQSAPGQQPYYSYQQPQYVQPVPYPGPATYYTEPSDYPAYGPPQPSPYYPTVGPIRERGGFWSALPGATSTRFSPFSSIRSSLPSGVSAGASLLGAALL
uniref:Uncharacterized protein n=1 Tax=Anopheles culicifacies TaxID=139723 RepID=A0A182MED3_9DIPT